MLWDVQRKSFIDSVRDSECGLRNASWRFPIAISVNEESSEITFNYEGTVVGGLLRNNVLTLLASLVSGGNSAANKQHFSFASFLAKVFNAERKKHVRTAVDSRKGSQNNFARCKMKIPGFRKFRKLL